MNDVYEESLAMHKKHGGKIEVVGKVPLENKEDLSLAYSPGVAAVSEAIAQDVENAKTLTLKKNTIGIISDGSAILGLGDLGPDAAIPVMEGKAALFKRFAGVDGFPICVRTNDVEEIIDLVKKIAPVFGGINLEDIAAPRCFDIEQRLRAELDIPVMHDDQHGTAIVVLAGLINAMHLAKKDLNECRVVVNGVGAAGVAIMQLLTHYAPKVKILALDSKGIMWSERDDLNPVKQKLIDDDIIFSQCGGDLNKALIDADVFIGVSKAHLLTEAHIKTMNDQPIIFALANPIPEIMPDEAKAAGAFVIATGRSDFPNQVNNVLAFPGIFRGALDHGIDQFTTEMFVAAAHAIADCVDAPTVDHVIPDPFDARVAKEVAKVIQ